MCHVVCDSCGKYAGWNSSRAKKRERSIGSAANKIETLTREEAPNDSRIIENKGKSGGKPGSLKKNNGAINQNKSKAKRVRQ